jgi:ABC-type transport system substrate-binding protein
LYRKVQQIVSSDVPVVPLWYGSNVVIAKKNVQNIQVNASGDWGFVRNLSQQ